MTINIDLKAVSKENNTTGVSFKFEGGTITLEMAPDEMIKTLPQIKETITSFLGFEASENEKRRAHEIQLQDNKFAADDHKYRLEETNSKLRDENRQQQEEIRKLREELSDARSSKVPTKKGQQ